MTAAVERWVAFSEDQTMPATDVLVVTPNDSADLPWVCRYIRCDTAGAVKITTREGNAVIVKFAAGETRALRASRIWATGTTVSGQIEAMI